MVLSDNAFKRIYEYLFSTSTLLGTTARPLKSEDISNEIVRGNVVGAKPLSAYGQFVATGANTNHVIWPDGTFVLPPSAGVQMSVVSTSINDDGSPVGTGVRTVDIHYLDAVLAEKTETIILNGTTPVLTIATNIRFIQCMYIATAGTTKSADGTITASNAGQIYSQISAGGRRCSSTARMVPAGKVAYINGASAGSISGTATTGSIVKISSSYFDGHDLSTQGIFMPFASIAMQDMSVAYNFSMPIGPFPAGSVILMEVTNDKAATIVGNWYGWIENA